MQWTKPASKLLGFETRRCAGSATDRHDVMRQKGRHFIRWFVLCLFALALIGIGWQALEVARHANGGVQSFFGWFGVIACTGNLAWIMFHVARIGRARAGTCRITRQYSGPAG